jgi:carbamoyltransferase
MIILGVSAFYHDSAACLVKNGELIFAVQEERITRRKHDNSFPVNAISECLAFLDITINDVDSVVFYEKPFEKFDRIVETILAFAPRGATNFVQSMSQWATRKIYQKKEIIQCLEKTFALDLKNKGDEFIRFSDHHLSHAASAFFPSPFDDAAVVTLDGVGEWTCTSIAHGKGATIEVLKTMEFPHSVGLLYSAFTYYCGFKVNSGEYKLMGLAPYGEPRFVDLIFENLLNLKADGSFQINMDYFEFCTSDRMIGLKFEKLFGEPRRKPEAKFSQTILDVAASIQIVIERLIEDIVKHARLITGSKHLCLAGGVALNCVANGKLRDQGLFDEIWVQPAAGDAGGCIGAALAYHYYLVQERAKPQDNYHDGMKGALLGPCFTQSEIRQVLNENRLKYETLSKAELPLEISKLLEEGQIIGWFQGRCEFGPRSLGNRSILADPRNQAMQTRLNLAVKKREDFRPFAPSILFEKTQEWFENGSSSPYMLFVTKVKEEKRLKKNPNEALQGLEKLKVNRSEISAVTHIDYSARVQTVTAKQNKLFFELISAFHKRTGVPVLVNTSFNVRGEPIVHSPKNAIDCFLSTDIDILVIENFLVKKSKISV